MPNLPWLTALEAAERRVLESELASAALSHYQPDSEDDDTLADILRVLDEWEARAADPDRLRPSDIVALRDTEGGERP